MISRKPKLQRQRKIFKQQVKNFPRANQMNINVATWGRLLKRSSPSIQNNHTQATSESPPSGMNISREVVRNNLFASNMLATFRLLA
jgi:protein kinase N